MTVVYVDYQTLVDRAIVIENKHQEMEEKKRKCDLQRQLRNTRLCFATELECQSHPMNLLGSTDQGQYQQPYEEVQHFSSQEPCLSSPTVTLMKTNTSTSEEDYDCGEIEHYKNDCLEKLAESNQSRNRQQEPEQNVHKKQVQGNKLKRNCIQGKLNNVDLITTHGVKEVVMGFIPVNSAPAMVLFDPSATHSFISREYVE